MRKHINIDPTDHKGLVALMEEYGEDGELAFGENQEGEFVTMTIEADRITTETMQKNGWLRRNVYWKDGTREELYKGKWRV